MGTFNTKAFLNGSSALIPQIAARIKDEFYSNGFDVVTEPLASGGYDISITKGGAFKAVMGMKSALKVTLIPMSGGVSFDAGVGIFGQQAIPTIISMFVFWPVLITQIWGMVQQSQLDDRALTIARTVMASGACTPSDTHSATSEGNQKYCTKCGSSNPDTAHFCSACGERLG